MKIKIINDQGVEEEIESFSQEEVDAKNADLTKKVDEQNAAIAQLEKEKDELKEKAGGVKEDHPNFKILKEALSKKDEEIAKINGEIAKDREERKVSGLIEKVSRGNEEFAKKVRFHLENTVSGMKATTDEELAKKIEAAVKLSQDAPAPGVFDQGIPSGGGAPVGGGNASGVEFTAREIALGAKLGISAEDYKKYGNDPRLKK